MNKELTFTSKFTNFEVVNSEFTKCRCYALAAGDNANGSDITMESIDNAIARGEFNNKPVVAHLYKDEDDGTWRVGGHDSKWIISNTSIELVDECIPFGVIPETSNIHKEDILESDGITVNTYVVMDILLWTGRYNIMDAAYNDDVYFNQSCEISINDYYWKDNDILAIKDFTFSALCLLNKDDDPEKNVRPCFGSCRVEKIKSFSLDEDKFKKNFELLLENFKKLSTDNKNVTKGDVKNMDFTKINEALSTVTFKTDSGNETVKYRLLNATDSKVFVIDIEDYKPYSFDYASVTENDADKIVVDFESKVEMSLSATDKIASEGFNEFYIGDEIESVKNAIFENDVPRKVDECTALLKTEYEKEYAALSEAYQVLNSKYEAVNKELSKYQEHEKNIQAEQHKAEIDEVFEKYASKLSKCAEFLVYKAKVNPADVTVDEVNEKLTLMVGKYMMENSKKQSFSYTPVESGFSKNDVNEAIHNRYGNLLDKFIG